MMTSIIEKLPIELKLKILSYKQSPPHFLAIKSGLFPIRDSLLPPIKEEDEWIKLVNSDDDEDELIFQMDDVTHSHHYVSLPQPFHYSYYSDSFL